MRKQHFTRFVERTKHLVNAYPVRHIHPSPKYYAVIVEPRRHPCMEYVCKNILRFLNDDWGLHIFHGTDNEEWIKDMFEGVENIRYTNLGVANLSIEDYNNLLTNNVKFHDAIESEVFLVFQTDSILFQSIPERYVQYDYVGAPWPHHGNLVGNGGLSIRRKTVMKLICDCYNRPTGCPEDLFYAICLRKEGSNVAPYEDAKQFSCELIPTTILPIGCHEHIQNINVKDFENIYSSYFIY